MTWKYTHGPRRKVVEVLKSTDSAWGGKRYYTVLLVCGHRQNTRNNACQRAPVTACCDSCRREAEETPR